MASPRQERYIRNLLDQRECPEAERTRWLKGLGDGTMTGGRASQVIGWLLKQPMKSGATATPDRSDITEPGVFIYEGTLYVVKFTRANGNGEKHLYAAEVVELAPTEGDRMDEHYGEARFKHTYDREARMMSKLREEHRMPVVELEAFMLRYSQCVTCAAWLRLFTSQGHTTPGGKPTPMGDRCYENAFGHQAMLESKRRARARARTA